METLLLSIAVSVAAVKGLLMVLALLGLTAVVAGAIAAPRLAPARVHLHRRGAPGQPSNPRR